MAREISGAGRRALVTGGGNGVGAAIGRAVVDAGAFVFVNDIFEDRANEVAKELGITDLAGVTTQDDVIMRILQAQTEAQGNIFAQGILEIVEDGFGFLRRANLLPSPQDVYVSSSQVRRIGLRTGDFVTGQTRPPKDSEKYFSLLRVEAVNGIDPEQARRRPLFENLVPVFPDEMFDLEIEGANLSQRLINLVNPLGKGQRALIVSPPKAGKTTLLKALMADAPDMPLSPGDIDAGKVRWGHEVAIGYFPPDHTGEIQLGMTAVEWLHQFDPDASRQDIHGLLGQMLFTGEEGLKPTDALSGGETARLLFCRIMLQKPNVLVLDEPTNHLDLESINALNIALQKYDGTVFLVTHDEDLMEEVGTRVWHFDGKTIQDFKGTYEEYAATLV